MEPTHGQSRTYKCFAANCKQREKEWPRLDNFKQHLQRMHKDISREDLIQQSNDWYDTEKKPRQPVSRPARATPSHGSHFLKSSPILVNEASCVESQNHLSPNWRPARNALRQQLTTPTRARHSSLSSKPNSSALFPPIRKSSPAPFQSPDIGFSGSHRTGQMSMGIFPTQLSPEFLLDSSQPLARGRPMAYTVPNPDTSALSELQDIGFSAPSGSFPVAQDDLAHIASNFTSESQSAFHPANQSPCSGFHPPSKATGSSSSSFISLDDIKAFINRSANGYNDKNAIFQQIMKAGIEKLAETQTQSTTATTTSSSPSAVTSTLTSHSDSANIRLPYDCPEKPCTKTYPRRCDLEKHLKRHRRPYGCTFLKCYESFGSKYDWKRHENSQHFQHECWKCALCSSSTSRNGQASTSSFAGQLFHRRNLFMAHMQKVHHLPPETARDHAHKQRIGRGCQTRFWCGFCKGIVELQRKGLDGADERFNHIDTHFKHKCHISDWVEMEGSEVKGHREEAGRDEEQEEDIDDVLGSDGIGDSPVRFEQDDNDETLPGGYYYDADDSGGGVSARSDTSQKRTLPPDIGGSSRPAQQRRTDAAPGKRTASTFVCCRCSDGPQRLSRWNNWPANDDVDA